MRNVTVTREEHIRYLQPWGKRDAVMLACTCRQSHGLRSWPNFEMAMASAGLERYYAPLWRDNPDVSRICRDYAAALPSA